MLYDDMHVFDVETNKWTDVSSKRVGDTIEARDSFTMVAANGILYAFGGQGISDKFLDDFFSIQVGLLT